MTECSEGIISKIFPWEKDKHVNPDLLDHLAAFTFPRIGQYRHPDSNDTTDLVLDLVEFFNPLRPPDWALLATNDYRVAEQVRTLVAAAVCLSYRKSIHPVDAPLLLEVMKGIEDPTKVPFGVEALKKSGLIIFEDIDIAPKFFGQWKGSVTPFFKGWDNPHTRILATTIHGGDWSALVEQEFYDKIGSIYGAVAKSILMAKTVVFTHTSPDAPARMRRAR